jgi:O-acetyl-ADP-ribose deacetylase (regulator of RNase III)
MQIKIGNTLLYLLQGDITEVDTDAIVNAANSSLMGGGGVDGAIHRKGGQKILKECKEIRSKDLPNGLPTGKAVITTGGDLKAKYVIHTAGPIWRNGSQDEGELLASSYRNSLKLARANNLKSIAFPSISTGAYGYPIDKACRVALSTVGNYIKNENFFEKVIFVLFSKSDLESYKIAIREEFDHK